MTTPIEAAKRLQAYIDRSQCRLSIDADLKTIVSHILAQPAPFKVGDRVRAKCNVYPTGMATQLIDKGTECAIAAIPSARHLIFTPTSYRYPADCFELVTEPSPAPAATEWRDGAPCKPWSEEWFLAQMKDGSMVVLRALPEEFSYDFKTADDTYFMRDRIARWSQLSTSEFAPPEKAPAPAVFSPGDIAECIQQCGGGIAKVGERFTVSSVRKDSGFGGEWLCFKETGSAAFESTRFKKVEPSPEVTAGLADGGAIDAGELKAIPANCHKAKAIAFDVYMAIAQQHVILDPAAVAERCMGLATDVLLTEAARREKEPT